MLTTTSAEVYIVITVMLSSPGVETDWHTLAAHEANSMRLTCCMNTELENIQAARLVGPEKPLLCSPLVGGDCLEENGAERKVQ